MNCPSVLPSAITEISDIPGGVAVTVILWDPREQDQLLTLARLQERIGEPTSNFTGHSGLHGGAGNLGHCPIIHNRTTVRFTAVTDGVRFDVLALPGSDVAVLRQNTRHRAAKLPRFVAR